MIELQADVVSTKGSIYSNRIRFASIPGELGKIGIFPGHTPFVSLISPGIAKFIDLNDNQEKVFVAGGILEIQKNYLTILVDTAVRAADLDEAKALAAHRKAQDSRRNAKSKSEIALVEAELAMLAEQIRSIKNLYRGIH